MLNGRRGHAAWHEQHDAITVDWISLAICDADPGLAANAVGAHAE